MAAVFLGKMDENRTGDTVAGFACARLPMKNAHKIILLKGRVNKDKGTNNFAANQRHASIREEQVFLKVTASRAKVY